MRWVEHLKDGTRVIMRRERVRKKIRLAPRGVLDVGPYLLPGARQRIAEEEYAYAVEFEYNVMGGVETEPWLELHVFSARDMMKYDALPKAARDAAKYQVYQGAK